MTPLEPVPIPTLDLRSWATKVASYLKALEIAQRTPSPKIIQLETVPKLAGLSAAGNGVMMFSIEEEAVIVSYNGQWHKLTMTPIP